MWTLFKIVAIVFLILFIGGINDAIDERNTTYGKGYTPASAKK